MTLKAAIGEIQTLMSALTGIAQAPQYPPESINDFPFIVCYPRTGTIRGAYPLKRVTWLHDIRLELHLTRQDIGVNIATIYDYVELIPHTIYNNIGTFTALDTVGNITGNIDYMIYNRVRTIGLSYNIGQVKIIQNEVMPA